MGLEQPVFFRGEELFAASARWPPILQGRASVPPNGEFVPGARPFSETQASVRLDAGTTLKQVVQEGPSAFRLPPPPLDNYPGQLLIAFFSCCFGLPKSEHLSCLSYLLGVEQLPSFRVFFSNLRVGGPKFKSTMRASSDHRKCPTKPTSRPALYRSICARASILFEGC